MMKRTHSRLTSALIVVAAALILGTGAWLLLRAKSLDESRASVPDRSAALPNEEQASDRIADIVASPEYQALLAKKQRGESLGLEDIRPWLEIMKLQSELVKEPKLFKSKASPPSTADEKALWEWWNQKRYLDPTFRWHRPIQFYGKVVDSVGNPIEGATIKIVVEMLDGKQKITLASDRNGYFELPMQTGKSIYVGAYKESYISGEKSGGNFEYADFFSEFFHVPTKAQPVQFTLDKE